MERILSPSNAPATVGHFRPEQIARRSTWARIDDRNLKMAALHVVHVVPANGSTVTIVNPQDPGTVDADGWVGWVERPGMTVYDVGGTTKRRMP